ncbi:hypothetical protein AB205_0171530, partial [Aquarana catesbeiana]
DFPEGIILVGGDFNLALEPQLDTSAQCSNISHSQLRALKKHLFDHRQLDLWRILYPEEHKYFSSVHKSYSRLDYFLSGLKVLEWNPSLEIGSFIWSDHSPVFLSIYPPQTRGTSWTWRLNDTLMSDPLCNKAIVEAIGNFVSDLEEDETALPLKWEALIAVLQGLFIQHGSRLKKEKSMASQNTLSKLHSLETLHKASQSTKILSKITSTRAFLL